MFAADHFDPGHEMRGQEEVQVRHAVAGGAIAGDRGDRQAGGQALIGLQTAPLRVEDGGAQGERTVEQR